MSGAAHYRKGARGEYMAMAHLQLRGWYVTRSYASKGPWDLLALKRGEQPLMVQVKAGASDYMRPSARAELLKLAHYTGSRAIVCHVPHPSASSFESVSYVELTTMADRVAFAVSA